MLSLVSTNRWRNTFIHQFDRQRQREREIPASRALTANVVARPAVPAVEKQPMIDKIIFGERIAAGVCCYCGTKHAGQGKNCHKKRVYERVPVIKPRANNMAAEEDEQKNGDAQ